MRKSSTKTSMSTNCKSMKKKEVRTKVCRVIRNAKTMALHSPFALWWLPITYFTQYHFQTDDVITCIFRSQEGLGLRIRFWSCLVQCHFLVHVIGIAHLWSWIWRNLLQGAWNGWGGRWRRRWWWLNLDDVTGLTNYYQEYYNFCYYQQFEILKMITAAKRHKFLNFSCKKPLKNSCKEIQTFEHLHIGLLFWRKNKCRTIIITVKNFFQKC